MWCTVVGTAWTTLPRGSRSIAHRLYVIDIEAFDFVLGTDSFVEHSQIISSLCRHPVSFKSTMVKEGNLYHWSSLNTHQATCGYTRRSPLPGWSPAKLRTISSLGMSWTKV